MLCALLPLLGILAGSRIYARQTKSRYALLLAERTRLAREMHDTVIQGCVGVLHAARSRQPPARSDPDEAIALVDHAKEYIRTTLEEARQAVWDLRSPVAGDSGVSSLIDLARRLGAEKAIQVDTEVTGNYSVHDLELDRTLLLVGREALRNAVAHGHPSHIAVRVAFRALDVELEVKDDGVGFDPGSSAPGGNGHFGSSACGARRATGWLAHAEWRPWKWNDRNRQDSGRPPQQGDHIDAEYGRLNSATSPPDPAQRGNRGLCPVADIEPAENNIHMPLYGGFRDIQ